MSEGGTGCVVIAYWEDDHDVAFVHIHSADEPEADSFVNIATAFERFICHGQTTEILEVHNYWHYAYVDARCDYWRETLRAQGYEINREEEE